jgi:uncharacterized protein affecting Mg2+/Co2+ transport
MNELPLLVLEELFRLLNVRDVVALGATSRRLQQASLREELWREFGERDFLLERATRDEYVAEYKMFGQWIDIYPRMLRAINTLLVANDLGEVDARRIRLRNVEDVREVLGDPATIEAMMWTNAPRQQQLSWLLAPAFVDEGRAGFPLLGSIDVYAANINHVLMNFDMASVSHGIIEPSAFSSLCLVDNGTGAVLQPINGYYERNQLYCVHMADSVLEFLERVAEQARSGVLVLDRGRLSAMPVQGDSVVVTITDGIKITASPMLAPSKSRWPDLQFIYEITIEGMPNVRRCQLSTRHWYITDVTGNIDEVEGAGVVGNFPTVTPGSRFQYKSCCNMRIDLLPGHMGGFFEFEVLLRVKHERAMEPRESVPLCPPFILSSRKWLK